MNRVEHFARLPVLLPAILLLAMSSLLLGGCASTRPGSAAAVPVDQFFRGLSDSDSIENYRINPLDKISVSVFQVEDLSSENVQVDASGNILLPLIGAVAAADRTTTELSQEIALRLGERYMQSPQVSVVVVESVSQKVTVEGSVEQAGVYELKGPTTLLQAIAMAQGPSRVAALGEIAIFRRINGQRMAGRFNLNAIRTGAADDPLIQSNDVVVVGFSNLKGAYRDIIQALPAVAVFTRL